MTHKVPEKFPRTLHAFRRVGRQETREILGNYEAMGGVVRLLLRSLDTIGLVQWMPSFDSA
jgi:hypothetical protein